MKTTNATKDKDQKKLHLKMKFKKRIPLESFISKYVYNKKAEKKLKSLGLTNTLIKLHTEQHFEMEATGDKAKLWEFVKWTKNPPAFYKVQEVHFHFVDLVEVLAA